MKFENRQLGLRLWSKASQASGKGFEEQIRFRVPQNMPGQMGQYRMIHFVRRHLALRPDIEVSIVLLDIIMSIKMLSKKHLCCASTTCFLYASQRICDKFLK